MKRQSLAVRIIGLVEAARQKVAAVANVAQVYTYYEIGRQIVEEEQGGRRRADYGKKLIEDLSLRLTQRFGRGWGTSNLEYMRKFYLMYSTLEISQTPFGESSKPIPQTLFGKSATLLRKSASDDLKLKKVGHDELGQMQTYINYFDRKVKLPEENPTIGILLTSEKVDQALVEMFTPDSEKNRIFVRQYTSVMPSKAALKRIVIEEKRKFEKERLLALAASKKGAAK